MGNTWEVEVWARGLFLERGDSVLTNKSGEYHYMQFWSGESFAAALWNFWRAKRQGYGCVTLHWR